MSVFDKTSIFSTDFEKYSNIKFHENPSGENQVVPCGLVDGQT
jgi:hypothetical protein